MEPSYRLTGLKFPLISVCANHDKIYGPTYSIEKEYFNQEEQMIAYMRNVIKNKIDWSEKELNTELDNSIKYLSHMIDNKKTIYIEAYTDTRELTISMKENIKNILTRLIEKGFVEIINK